MEKLEKMGNSGIDTAINEAIKALLEQPPAPIAPKVVQSLLDFMVADSQTSVESTATAVANMLAQTAQMQNQQLFGASLKNLVNSLSRIQDAEMFSAAEAEVMVEEVKPYLPKEVTEAAENKLAEVKTPDNKIHRIDWIKILEIITPFLLFIAGLVASSEHEHKEEICWSSVVEYLQEDIELQKQNQELKEEILDRVENFQCGSVEIRN